MVTSIVIMALVFTESRLSANNPDEERSHFITRSIYILSLGHFSYLPALIGQPCGGSIINACQVRQATCVN